MPSILSSCPTENAGGSFAGGSLPSIFSTIIAKRAEALPDAGRSGGSFFPGAIEPSYRSGRGAQPTGTALPDASAFPQENPGVILPFAAGACLGAGAFTISDTFFDPIGPM